MSKHSTNYSNAFITVAEDCPAETGSMPPSRGGKKSIANYQFELLYEQPYQYCSDELLFLIHCLRKEIPVSERAEAKEDFFSKGQPCLRASPLTKRYGWGVHYNEEEKIAIYGREETAYQAFVEDESLETIAAMRSKKK